MIGGGCIIGEENVIVLFVLRKVLEDLVDVDILWYG